VNQTDTKPTLDYRAARQIAAFEAQTIKTALKLFTIP
jgi:hypothetical protein